ncbi:hypothetical protein HDV64DRAFT_188621 [Trichoderma sp. TUCIM 5745]
MPEPEQVSLSNVPRARRACRFCTKRKVRCSKELPQCDSCRRQQQACYYDYMNSGLGSAASSSEDGSHRLTGAEFQRSQSQPVTASRRAAIRFIDYDMFLRSQVAGHMINAAEPIPTYVQAMLGDRPALQQIVAGYYRLAAPWLPFISKRRVVDQLLNPLVPFVADAAFLLLCMKLVTQPPGEDDQWSECYAAASSFRIALQLQGVLSLNLLQGCVLLSVYEYGNATYPDAHISIGICLKHASALGLGWVYSRPNSEHASVRMEVEEKNRTWWSIFLLERLIGLGNPHQLFMTPEPQMNAQLPWSDEDWQNGTDPGVASTLSSPPFSVGRFASIAQASFLLSRVFQHISAPAMNSEFGQQESEQLERTLNALIRYSHPENGASVRLSCYKKAVAFSALMTLRWPHLQLSQADPRLQLARHALDSAAHSAADAAGIYLTSEPTPSLPGDTSPFLLPWFYMSGIRCIETKAEVDLGLIEAALGKLRCKWKAAGMSTSKRYLL